jgi:hypothetical protein
MTAGRNISAETAAWRALDPYDRAQCMAQIDGQVGHVYGMGVVLGLLRAAAEPGANLPVPSTVQGPANSGANSAADLVQEEKHNLGGQALSADNEGDWDNARAFRYAARCLQRVEDKMRAAAEPSPSCYCDAPEVQTSCPVHGKAAEPEASMMNDLRVLCSTCGGDGYYAVGASLRYPCPACSVPR